MLDQEIGKVQQEFEEQAKQRYVGEEGDISGNAKRYLQGSQSNEELLKPALFVLEIGKKVEKEDSSRRVGARLQTVKRAPQLRISLSISAKHTDQHETETFDSYDSAS